MSETPQRYLVCTVPRSGSTYFCHLLSSTQLWGMQPYEPRRFEYILRYFRTGFEGVDWSSAGLAELFAAAFAASSTSNGVQGFKVMWEHFDRIIDVSRRRGADKAKSRAELEKQLAAGVRFVWLRRRNQVRQAISWNRALQSNGWNIETQRAFQGRPVYDFPGIGLAQRRIRRAESAWQSYFNRCGVEPLIVYYEDYLEDIPAAMASLGRRLGLPPTSRVETETKLLDVQSDRTTDEWESRYRRDSSSALAAIRAYAAALASSEWRAAYRRRIRSRDQARAYSGR